MRREAEVVGQGEEAPIRLVQFTRSFHIGGTEVQVLELLRGLPSQYRLQVSVLQDAGPLVGTLRQLGYTPEEFPLNGSLMRFNTAQQIFRLARWFKRHQVDLVHVHDFYSTMLVVPAAKLVGAKVIVGRLDLAHWHGPAQRAVHAQFSRMADHVVANAEAIRRML
ncbi:MAG TPA: glycosyltransferase family 4 protein, partial [Myxococcaceae bacterium]